MTSIKTGSCPVTRSSAANNSEIEMQPQSRHQHWPARLVVAGIVHMLQVKRDVRAAPDVCSVVAFEDFFAAVGERAISQKKTDSSQREVTRVIAGNCIERECGTGPVIPSAPEIAAIIPAEF